MRKRIETKWVQTIFEGADFFCTTTFYNIFLQLLFYCSKIVSVTENLFDVLCFGLMILSPLADGSRDLSQAVDKITVAKAEQVFQK